MTTPWLGWLPSLPCPALPPPYQALLGTLPEKSLEQEPSSQNLILGTQINPMAHCGLAEWVLRNSQAVAPVGEVGSSIEVLPLPCT